MLQSGVIHHRAGMRPPLRWLVAVLVLTSTIAPAMSFAKPPEEAQLLAKQAYEFYNKGDWMLAITLYRKAFALSRQAEFLFGAARAEQKSGDVESARRDYEFVRDMLPASDPLYAKTLTSLADLARQAAQAREQAAVAAKPQPAPAKPEPAPAKPEPAPAVAVKAAPATSPVVVAPATPAASPAAGVGAPAPAPAVDAAWKRPVGWGAVGLGGALVVSGVIVAVLANSAQSTLSENKNPTTGKYDPARISLADAQSQQGSINGQFTAGWVLLGAGAVVGGVGGWLLATAPSTPRVTFGPSGLLVDGRF